MSIKILAITTAALSLMATEAFAQVNHNTTRSNKRPGGVTAPVDTGTDATAVKSNTTGTGNTANGYQALSLVGAPTDTDIDANTSAVAASAATDGDTVGHVTLIKSRPGGDDNGGTSNPILKTSQAGDGGTVVKTCGFVAAPQGFTVSVIMKDYDTSSSLGLKTSVIVDDITPWIFATSSQGAAVGITGHATDPGPTTALAENLGLQSGGNGVHPFGGWARTTTGLIITGTVFHIRGHSAGTPYSGGYTSHQFDGGMADHFGTISCSTSMFNSAISKLNNAVGGSAPNINGASTAYHDTGYVTGSGPSGGGSDWAGDLYNAYYATGAGPGWHVSPAGVTAPSGGAGVTNEQSAAPGSIATPSKPLPTMPAVRKKNDK